MLGVTVAHGLIAMGMAGLTVESKECHKVVRQLHGLPLAIVKLVAVRAFVVDGIGLGEIVEILRSAAKVLGGIGSMAESELPALIETNGLTL